MLARSVEVFCDYLPIHNCTGNVETGIGNQQSVCVCVCVSMTCPVISNDYSNCVAVTMPASNTSTTQTGSSSHISRRSFL